MSGTVAAPLLRSRQLVRAGLVAALLVGALAAAFLVYAWRELQRNTLDRAQMLARVLDDHTASTLASTELILHALQPALLARTPSQLAQDGSAVLRDALPGRPFLRSLSLADEQGLVLASSNGANLGQRLPARWLQTPAAGAPGARLAALAEGRDLDRLDVVPLAQARVLALPMLLPADTAQGRRWLVALINPDHFATQFDRLLDRSGMQALLLDGDRRYLAGTDGVRLPAGTPLKLLPLLEQHLPQRESGSGAAAGSSGQPALGAFRLLRQWPLLVLVEDPDELWPDELHELGGWVAIFVLCSWGPIGAAVSLGSRALRRDERLRGDLERANAATRASESLKLAILQSSPDAIVSVDGGGRVIDFNAAAERMFGYSAAFAIGAAMQDLIVPERHRAAHQAGMARYRASGVPRVLNRRIEVEALRADGTVFPVEMIIVPLRTEAGELFTATLRDITERQQAERALRDSEARANATFEQAAVGVFQQAFDLRLLRVNQTMCGMLGYSREELLAASGGMRLHPDDREHALEGRRALLRGDASHYTRELRLRCKDGRYLWTRLTASLVRDEFDNPSYLMGVLENVDGRRQAEQERTTLLQRYREATDELERQRLALDEHAIFSIVGADGAIVYANSRLSAVTGFAATEMVGRRNSLLTGEADPSRIVGPDIQACLQAGQIWKGELLHRCKDGSSFWASSTAVPMRDEQGRLQQIYLIETDITARVLAERALRDSEAQLVDARQREWQVGARIQQSLLVTAAPADLEGLQISSYSQASQGIDGDFVEVLRVGADCVDIIAGDVMGKGLPAAMMGAATKLQFSRSIAELLLAGGDGQRSVPSPSSVVAAVHRAMTPTLQALEAFVTLCYLRVDTRRRRVTWVGCGHEETLLASRDAVLTLDNHHPPLGVLDSTDYVDSELALQPGDTLFLCSDGVTDALRADGERVGRERVADAVARHAAAHDTPAALLHALRAELLTGGVRLQDDVTIAVVQLPADGAALQRTELAVDLASIRPLRAFIARHCAGPGLDEGEAGLLEVACVEAFTNVVRHASGLLAGAPVELVARRRPGLLQVELVYVGDAFEAPAEAEETTFSGYPEGGFGLHIMRAGSDRLEYEHRAGVNTVRLSKQLR